jgi:hypothetical protein
MRLTMTRMMPRTRTTTMRMAVRMTVRMKLVRLVGIAADWEKLQHKSTRSKMSRLLLQQQPPLSELRRRRRRRRRRRLQTLLLRCCRRNCAQKPSLLQPLLASPMLGCMLGRLLQERSAAVSEEGHSLQPAEPDMRRLKRMCQEC